MHPINNLLLDTRLTFCATGDMCTFTGIEHLHVVHKVPLHSVKTGGVCTYYSGINKSCVL